MGMRFLVAMIKWLLVLVLLLVGGVIGWLMLAPPDLIRVADGYSAKIVCSNVFLAGRNADEVLQVDVQAPGHPILKYVTVSVDESAGTVKAGLFGFLGTSLARHAAGFGCATIADGDLEASVAPAPPSATAPGAADVLWPAGERVEESQNPIVTDILDDTAMTGPGMRAVVVVKDGRIVGERYGEGFSASTPLIGWSMTKTVNAALVGTVVGAGRLSVGQKSLLKQWSGDPRSQISLADLLSMSSGLAFNEDYGDVTDVTRMLYLEPDMAGFAASMPTDAGPGEAFSYSSGTANILARIWQNAVGNEGEAARWPHDKLFGPLGMASATLEQDARGTFTGSSYLYATARDWARFGQFLLQDGTWNGAPLLPPGWVAMMREPNPVSDSGFGAEYTKGQMWLRGPEGGTPEGEDPDEGFSLPADTVWALGHDGQSMAIIPSQGIVVVRLGLTPSKLGYKPQGMVAALAEAL